MKPRPTFITFIQDVVSIVSIIGLSYFLVSYFLNGVYLETGYQDWLYHAYKIYSIQQYGLSSWDHIWANGLNHWRAYQYLPHLLTIFYVQHTGLSITQSMIHITIFVIIISRILWYIVLRGVGISPFFSLLATLLSLTIPQQWQTLQDFSIFIALLYLPVFTFFWIKSQTNSRYLLLASTLTGLAWVFHPLIGLTATGLFGLGLLTQLTSIRFRYLLALGLFFFLGSAGFFIPMFTISDNYANSRFFSMEFIHNLFFHEWLGIGLPVFFTLCATIFLRIFIKAPRWATILIIYTCCMLGLYLLAWYGYTPHILNKTQFTRTNTIIGILSTAGIAGILHYCLNHQPSRFLWGVLVAYLAIAATSTVELSSKYSPAVGANLPDPIGNYFHGRPQPQGSIYLTDIGTASYTHPQLRFALSYFEHQLPNPLSVRLMQILRPDRSISGSSEYDIQLINDYLTVLRVEYLFLPRYSPLVTSLTNEDPNAPIQFKGYISTATGSFAVLQNTRAVHYAYLAPPDDNFTNFSNAPAQPTADPSTFIPWDNQISQMAQAINQKFIPVPLIFTNPNQLQINLPAQIPTGYQLIIAQNYDPNWSINSHPELEIKPTTLRFINVNLPSTFAGQTLTLSNTWPSWYWPTHYLSYSSIVIATLITVWMTMFKPSPKPVPISKYHQPN